MKLIDIGCGEGYVLKAIIKNFSGFDLIGINISETRLRKARESLKSLPNVEFIRADAQKYYLEAVLLTSLFLRK